MGVQLISQYLIALLGLVLGTGVGLVLMWISRRRINADRLSAWDTRVTLPLLLGVAVAHAVLIPVVELERQILFGLYFLGVIGAIGLAVGGLGIWRLGAILLPLGSIFGYAYFAVIGHQADVVGLIVKAAEVVTVLAALKPLLGRDRVISRRDLAV